MRTIPPVTYDFLKAQEACVLRVYDDRRPGAILVPGARALGTLTAGVGHTGGLSIGQVVTQQDADGWLAYDVGVAARGLEACIGADGIASLTENQYAATLSFVFNLGANPSWTIWRRIKERAFDQVPLEMMKFVNSDGKKLSGLVKRRAAEVQLWSRDEPGSREVDLPSSVTRETPTPPTSSDPVPISKSKSIIAAVAAAIAAAPSAINPVIQTIAPYADKSDYVQHMIGILAAIAAGCAVLAVVFMWIHKRKAQN